MRRRTSILLAVVAVLVAFSVWRYGSSGPLVVTVRSANEVELDGTPLALSALAPRVEQALQRRPDRRVIVRVRSGAPASELVAVMDEVRRAGAADTAIELLP